MGQIEEMIYLLLTVVGVTSQVMTDGVLFVYFVLFFFFFPAYSPASETKLDRFIHRLIREADKWED